MRQLVVAVTGAKGYIGSELCDELLARGHHVIQIDKEINNGYVETILPGFKPSLEYADCIVHLAAESGIANCQADPQKAIKSNMIATSMLMDFATNYGDTPVPLIFASSAAANHPTSSLYAMGKYYGEQLAIHYNENYNGQNYVLRFSNIYGGVEYTSKKSSVVSKLVNAIQDDKPFTISGDGSQTRDFIHINRIVNAIIKMVEMVVFKDPFIAKVKALHNPIDVCTGTQLSIKDLVDSVVHVTNKSVNIVYDKEAKNVGVNTGVSNPEMAKTLGLIPVTKGFYNPGPQWYTQDLVDYLKYELLK